MPCIAAGTEVALLRGATLLNLPLGAVLLRCAVTGFPGGSSPLALVVEKDFPAYKPCTLRLLSKCLEKSKATVMALLYYTHSLPVWQGAKRYSFSRGYSSGKPKVTL